MTQFALAITKNSCNILVSLEKQRDNILLEIGRKLFPNSPDSEIYLLDLEGKNVDQLMLDAQKTIDTSTFELTEIFKTINKIVPIVDEIVFWYGSDYDDLDSVYEVSTLLSKIEEAVSESTCELYVRYKPAG